MRTARGSFTAGSRLSCWRAWEKSVQIEAMASATDLFPNLVHASRVAEAAETVEDTSGSEDIEAGAEGIPFAQTDDPDEWVQYIDWESPVVEQPTV